MSYYQQPFSQRDLSDGTYPLALFMDLAGTAASCSFVNSTPYWFRIKDKTGNVIAFIGPNSKGNENFTMNVDDKVLLQRAIDLPTVTSAVSSNLFYIRYNSVDGTSALTDYNTNTAVGANTSQQVFMTDPLPAGNSTIGKVGLATGSAHVGSVDIDKIPDVGIKSGQSLNVNNLGDLGKTRLQADIFNVNAILQTKPVTSTNGGTAVYEFIDSNPVSPFPSVAIIRAVVVQARSTNVNSILVGIRQTDPACFELAPGAGISLNISQLSYIRAQGNKGDKISVIWEE